MNRSKVMLVQLFANVELAQRRLVGDDEGGRP